MPTALIDGIEIYYETHGSGKPAPARPMVARLV
jgi:hypothetical protein